MVQLHAEQDEQFDGFECERKEALAYTMTLPGTQAANLLQMTPFAWRATPEVQQRLAHGGEFVCETDFALALYRRHA